MVLPSLAGTGFFLVGVVQGRASRDGDVTRHLSTYPVSTVRLHAATAISGASIVAVTVAALAIGLTGGIVAGIVEWPESLFPRGLTDLMVGVFLISLACHSLGLMVGGGENGGWLWLAAWPGALALVSLIVIKGLGPPLVVLLAAFIVVSLCGFLVPPKWQRMTTLGRSLVVLILVAIPLYWMRYSCVV